MYIASKIHDYQASFMEFFFRIFVFIVYDALFLYCNFAMFFSELNFFSFQYEYLFAWEILLFAYFLGMCVLNLWQPLLSRPIEREYSRITMANNLCNKTIGFFYPSMNTKNKFFISNNSVFEIFHETVWYALDGQLYSILFQVDRQA